MSRSRFAVITVAVGALLGALGVSSASAAPRVGTDASEVIHWNQVATTTLAGPEDETACPTGTPDQHGMVQSALGRGQSRSAHAARPYSYKAAAAMRR